MGSLFGEICHIFCCPPRPSHIVAKFAFLPPIPTYSIVQSSDGNDSQIIFKPEVGLISDYAKSKMEVFYTMTKRKSRIACLYIRYDPAGSRHALASSNHDDLSNRITILFSHGNAVDIGQMAGFLYSLSQRFGVNVLVYDYSGYGASTGQTLEANLYADAEAALGELRERYQCPLNRIVLYGQSIGTAPTVDLATHYSVAGVVLHSALMSGLRVVCPGTTRRFCFDPFNSIDKVENIQSPTLVIHGTDDHVIGVHHGKELFARLPNPLDPLWVEGADHNNIELFHEYAIRLEKFFQVDMRQSMIRSQTEHQQNTHSTEVEWYRSSVCRPSVRKSVDDHPPQQNQSSRTQSSHSWNSTQSSDSAKATPINNEPAPSTPLVTSAASDSDDLVENKSSPPAQEIPSFRKSNEGRIGVGTATLLTGSSISLPLDTINGFGSASDSGRKSMDSSDKRNPSRDRPSSERGFLRSGKRNTRTFPTYGNHDL